MLKVFLDVVLPVFLVAVAGAGLGRWKGVPVGPASTLAFYLFSPALTFHSMATTTVSAGDAVKVVVVMIVTFIVTYAAATAWSLARGHDPSMRAAFALGATIPNNGNMGLPVSQLAFGATGLQIAVMNFVAGSVMTNSVGVLIASMASGFRWSTLLAPLRYPALYAAMAGILVKVLGIKVPVTIDAPVTSMAGAAVPVMLVVLGLQLRDAGGTDLIGETIVVTLGRLVLSPVIAFGTATALHVHGDTKGTLIVLAAMPTAVLTTILATEFKARPAFVTRVVVSTTLSCMLTLTLIITLVK